MLKTFFDWLTDPHIGINRHFGTVYKHRSKIYIYIFVFSCDLKLKVVESSFSTIKSSLIKCLCLSSTHDVALMQEIFTWRCNLFFSPFPSSFCTSGTFPLTKIQKLWQRWGKRCGRHEGLQWGWSCSQLGWREEDFSLKFALFSWLSVSLTDTLAAVLCITSFFS